MDGNLLYSFFHSKIEACESLFGKLWGSRDGTLVNTMSFLSNALLVVHFGEIYCLFDNEVFRSWTDHLYFYLFSFLLKMKQSKIKEVEFCNI